MGKRGRRGEREMGPASGKASRLRALSVQPAGAGTETRSGSGLCGKMAPGAEEKGEKTERARVRREGER